MNKSYYTDRHTDTNNIQENYDAMGEQEPTYNYMLSPYGTEYGLSVGQEPRVEDLNRRILDRVFPDIDLKPNFDPRPVSTKYAHFPVVDSYARTTEPYKPYLDYYPEVIFNPGNAKAPVNGILKKIDLESDLRNQRCLLAGKYDLGNRYVPPLESDMYKVTVKSSDGDAAMRAHPLLFSPFLVESSVDAERAIPQTVGTDRFNNHTRTQLRSSA